MKVILQEIKEESEALFKLYAEIEPSIGGYTTLTFSTVWTGAKNPDEPQIKYRVHLTEDARRKLKELL